MANHKKESKVRNKIAAFKLPENRLADAKEQAKNIGITFSDLVNMAVQNFIDANTLRRSSMKIEEVLRNLSGGESIRLEVDTDDSTQGILTLHRTSNGEICGAYYGEAEYFSGRKVFSEPYAVEVFKMSVTMAEFLAQCGNLVNYDWIEYKYRYELKAEVKKLRAELKTARAAAEI